MWNAQGHRANAWAHRVELRDAGVAWGAAVAAWDAVHRDHDVPCAVVTKEVPAEAPWPQAPERLAPTRWWGLTASPAVTEGPLPVVRGDPDRVGRWLAAERPLEGGGADAAVAWLGALCDRGAEIFVAVARGEVAGTATAVAGPEGTVRLQEVHVGKAWRRRGVGRSLVTAACGGRPSVVMAADGAVADWYRALGFSAGSRLVAVRRPG